ncbi:deoxycytidylate deaminase-like [Arctopsyche grandis]|uniref:deoxycytidylate deaminase-like n=1 Tax=Arctopsyche grandis TaxID=121162 RepID=UPI00406D6EC6
MSFRKMVNLTFAMNTTVDQILLARNHLSKLTYVMEVSSSASSIPEQLESKVAKLHVTPQSPKTCSLGKRSTYLEWTDYFMALAFLAAKRSKDPCTQVGACIISPDNKVVGMGYNGMPWGCSDDEYPWCKDADSSYDNKYAYVCHAEMNAILNKNVANVRDCTIYVALFPCNECAKLIIQSGIKEIVYLSDKHSDKPGTKASKRMLDSAKITYRQYIPKQKKIIIDFDEINSDT